MGFVGIWKPYRLHNTNGVVTEKNDLRDGGHAPMSPLCLRPCTGHSLTWLCSPPSTPYRIYTCPVTATADWPVTFRSRQPTDCVSNRDVHVRSRRYCLLVQTSTCRHDSGNDR